MAFLKSEQAEKGPAYLPSARVMACTPPFRSNNEWLRFDQVRMDVPTFESWWRGKAELMIKCFQPNTSTSMSYTELVYESNEINVYRNQSNDWVVRQFALFYWNNVLRTQSVLFYFYEYEDTGHTKEVNISGSFKLNDGQTISPGTKFSIKNNDKTIGRFVVDQYPCPPYEDEIGRQYYQIESDFAFILYSHN